MKQEIHTLDKSQSEYYPWVMESSSYQACMWASRKGGAHTLCEGGTGGLVPIALGRQSG